MIEGSRSKQSFLAQGGRKHMTHVQNIDAWGIDPEAARTDLQVLSRDLWRDYVRGVSHA